VAISGGNLHSLALTPLSNFNPTNPIVLTLSNSVAQTNTVGANGVIFYQINVPTNADFATNLLLSADAPLNIWFTTNPPSLTTLLLGGVTNGASILSTTSMPTNIVPGSTYYLGVQNTNNISVTHGIRVDFHFVATGPLTNTVPISSIIHTNIGGTNGFLLIWFAPTNALFRVQWTSNLFSSWNTFTNIIGYDTNVPVVDPSNAQFDFFDDGSQTGGVLDPGRFYRLILLNSTTPPVTNTGPSTNTVPISSISFTNSSGTNGFLLTWYAPTNDLFMVQWSPDCRQAGAPLRILFPIPARSPPPMASSHSLMMARRPADSVRGVSIS
jgi:hypothetical protein